MGGAAFQELLRRSDRFDIVLLARPGKNNFRKLAPYRDTPGVEIVWGDLIPERTTYCISEEWFPLPQICIRSAH